MILSTSNASLNDKLQPLIKKMVNLLTNVTTFSQQHSNRIQLTFNKRDNGVSWTPHCSGFTITDTPNSVGLLLTSDQPVAETST